MSINPQLNRPIKFAEKFNGADMLKIDIANTYGLDKELFPDRIKWFDTNEKDILNNLVTYMSEAEEPLLFKKAVLAWKEAKQGNPIHHNMFMDATASGLQIMAVLSGCKDTARQVNLVHSSERKDSYSDVNQVMNDSLGVEVPRKKMKKAVMTHYYNSKKTPAEVFEGDENQLDVFYKVLEETFPGAEAVMNVINSAWNPEAMYHEWTLPDGHVSHVKVTEAVDAKVELNEYDNKTFTYRFYDNKPSERSTSLAPNVIHSLDAYVIREVVRRADFPVAHIHDALTSHPNHMPKVMDLYRDILAEMAEMNLLEDIISQITGSKVELCKYSDDLANDIRCSEYALS